MLVYLVEMFVPCGVPLSKAYHNIAGRTNSKKKVIWKDRLYLVPSKDILQFIDMDNEKYSVEALFLLLCVPVYAISI